MTDTSGTPELTGLTLAELFQLYRAILAELRRRKVVQRKTLRQGTTRSILSLRHSGASSLRIRRNRMTYFPSMANVCRSRLAVVSVPPRRASCSFHHSGLSISTQRPYFLSSVDYAVWKAAKLPAAVVRAAGVYSNHVNGAIVFAKQTSMDHAQAVDITEAIRAADNEHRRPCCFRRKDVRSWYARPANTVALRQDSSDWIYEP